MKVALGTPESFGWLRRPDLDAYAAIDGRAIVYETPMGEYHVFPPDLPPLIARDVPDDSDDPMALKVRE